VSSTPEIEELFRQLHTGDPEAKLSALNALTSLVRRVASETVEELRYPNPFKYIVLERLGLLGSVCVQPLRHLLESSTDNETRVAAAAALVTFAGEDLAAAKNVLLAALTWGNPDMCLAARVLAQAHVQAAVPYLRAALNRAELSGETAPTVECLVQAMRSLGQPLPAEFLNRARDESPGWLSDKERDRFDR
jgi:hypothetical protein